MPEATKRHPAPNTEPMPPAPDLEARVAELERALEEAAGLLEVAAYRPAFAAQRSLRVFAARNRQRADAELHRLAEEQQAERIRRREAGA